MRIIKLSTSEFESLQDVVLFFRDELASRNSPGKFRITFGRISEGGLSIGEPLLFSYKTIVRYTAQAASKRLDNHDEFSETYPYYFLVNMSSVRPANVSLNTIENRLRETGRRKEIARSQGWPTIPDSTAIIELWQSLRRE